MKVRDLMTSNPCTCSAGDSLSNAAMRMWNEDCGVLPIVDGARVVGMITDRDICMALAMKGAAPDAVQVGDVGVTNPARVHSCRPNDEVEEALQTMQEHQVRRLPVLRDDDLVGLISLNDIALEAHAKKGPMGRPTHKAFTKAMQGICSHRLVVLTA